MEWQEFATTIAALCHAKSKGAPSNLQQVQVEHAATKAKPQNAFWFLFKALDAAASLEHPPKPCLLAAASTNPSLLSFVQVFNSLYFGSCHCQSCGVTTEYVPTRQHSGWVYGAFLNPHKTPEPLPQPIGKPTKQKTRATSIYKYVYMCTSTYAHIYSSKKPNQPLK